MKDQKNHCATGNLLALLRRDRGWRFRDVHKITQDIAERRKRDDFAICPSRLKGIETGELPSIYKLYSLSVIYNICLTELLEWYGVPLVDKADKEVLRQFERSNPFIKHSNNQTQRWNEFTPIGCELPSRQDVR